MASFFKIFLNNQGYALISIAASKRMRRHNFLGIRVYTYEISDCSTKSFLELGLPVYEKIILFIKLQKFKLRAICNMNMK